jgi:hypothetical protein
MNATTTTAIIQAVIVRPVRLPLVLAPTHGPCVPTGRSATGCDAYPDERER